MHLPASRRSRQQLDPSETANKRGGGPNDWDRYQEERARVPRSRRLGPSRRVRRRERQDVKQQQLGLLDGSVEQQRQGGHDRVAPARDEDGPLRGARSSAIRREGQAAVPELQAAVPERF